MQNRPRGIRRLFWALWAFKFDRRLKATLGEIEKKHGNLYLVPELVHWKTEELMQEEASRLLRMGAIEEPYLYWNGVWFKCEVGE